MATSPNYAATPSMKVGQVATANTNRDGTGTLVTILTAASGGTRIDAIVLEATGTTTAGVVRLFLYDGTNTRLLKELLVSAITPSTSVEVFTTTWVPPGQLVLPNGWSLKAGTHNAETFNVFALAGDF